MGARINDFFAVNYFAEEMDADWKVTTEFSPQETEIYGSPRLVSGYPN